MNDQSIPIATEQFLAPILEQIAEGVLVVTEEFAGCAG
jgi:hypothetical protein